MNWMRKILTIFLFFICNAALAKTVIIGNGKGIVSKTNMNGLQPGDVLAITPGKYGGGNFSNLYGISIINNGGLVTFTGKVDLGADNDLLISGTGDGSIFYGFKFTGGGFTIKERCSGLRIYNCEARDISRLVDLSENQVTLTYTGDTSTILLNHVAIANIKMNNCGNLFCGSFGLAFDLHNVVDSLAIFNVTYDSTNEEGMVVFGANLYRYDFHDIIIHEAPVYNNRDVGMFSVYGGNGQIHNVYRKGGWGWLCRLFGASIGDTVRDIWIYNNIDLGSTCYGTAEVRCEFSQWKNSKLFKGVNIHIVNNTSGNKKDVINYTTAVALIPNIELGYSCEIKNNLSFNNQLPGRSGNGFEYWNVNNPPDTAKNFYFANYKDAGLKDTINCYLLPESPLIDQGVPIAHINKDIEGNPRPFGNAFDVGAREFAGPGNTSGKTSTPLVIRKSYIILFVFILAVIITTLIIKKILSGNGKKKVVQYTTRRNVKR